MILGIDTSCYTTSLALCDEKGRLLAQRRRLLSVDMGECGLRQSDALFQHVKNLPELAGELFAECPGQLDAVAVSVRPRPADGSYMPVFLAGKAVAESIAAAAGVPCFATSHQEGHIAAALASVNLQWDKSFLALHLSGGTGEILQVKPEGTGYQVDVIGNCDLPPGQFIDRVGVALGLPFPAGPHLEELAAKCQDESFRLSGSVNGCDISFSGPETAAQRGITAGEAPENVAAAVLDNIAKSLHKAISNAKKKTNCSRVLLAGGVACNQRLRQKLAADKVKFALPEFSGDNAYGVAVIGSRMLQMKANKE